MRSSDAMTLFRAVLALVIVYLVLLKVDPLVTIAVISLAFLTDGFDGYLAIRSESGGSVSFLYYLLAVAGNARAKDRIKRVKSRLSISAPFGARMDVAADRVMEFSFWILFAYLGIVPLILFLLVVFMHAFADALMGARGTSSKMHSAFSRAVYSSNASRAAINILKWVTYVYLVLVYVSAYPVNTGYALVGLLFVFVMLRGIAEISEAHASFKEGR